MAQSILPEIKIAAPKNVFKARSDQKQFLIFVLTSVAIHILVLLIGQLTIKPRMIVDNESAVDVDLLTDLNMSAPKDTAIPLAKQALEEAVPSNILPQLPKKFEVEQEHKPDQPTFVEEKDKALKDKKTEEKPEAAQPEMKKDDELQKVKQEDALKRLALEKLRLQEKKSDELKAPNKDALARLKEELAKTKGLGSSGTSGTGKPNRYMNMLQSSIKRNWSLPETFKMEKANMRAVISIYINKKGELNKIKMIESSGNSAYDEACIRAVQSAVPLPPPPDDLVDERMDIPFRL